MRATSTNPPRAPGKRAATSADPRWTNHPRWRRRVSPASGRMPHGSWSAPTGSSHQGFARPYWCGDARADAVAGLGQSLAALGACAAGRLARPPFVSAFLGLAVSFSPGPPAARGKPGDPDGDRQDGVDGEQRSDDGKVDAEAFKQELHADEDRDRRQAVMQVNEAVPQPFAGKVKVP